MAALDWLNKLFQGEKQTRGLSGASASDVALGDTNSFYNFRLRRHYTDEAIAENLDRVWFTNDDPEARTGLGPHIAEVVSQGEPFTDVLVILSAFDFDEAFTGDTGFVQRLTSVLQARFGDYARRSGLGELNRPLGVWVVREGASEIGGDDFGLVDGEFITGIVPNLYRAPGPSSKKMLSIRAAIPGVWEGLREIGALYDDQSLFTLGSHWLDNFNHKKLRDAAVYRVQRADDGGFFHLINPDLQDRYQITTTEQNGQHVITLSTRANEPLAHMVLEVPSDVEESPVIAPPMVDESSDLRLRQGHRAKGSRTILPETQSERIFTLQERGALLQKVHFSQFMLGYDIYVDGRGSLGTVVPDIAATFQVRKRTVSIVANRDGVLVDGEALRAGESRLIEGDAVLKIGKETLEYYDLRGVEADGWPYVGEIRRPASSTYMLWGKDYSIGRSRDCRVVLPNETRNENIVWKPSVDEGATIRSKKGEIPKSHFYTDSIMVSSVHAALVLKDDLPTLACRAANCYAFVRRGDEVFSLARTTKEPAVHEMQLFPSDEILVGNCLFQVSFTPGEGASELSALEIPALPELSDALVESVAEPVFEEVDLSGADDMDLGGDEPALALSNLPMGFDEEPAPPVRREVPRGGWSISEVPEVFEPMSAQGPSEAAEVPAANVPTEGPEGEPADVQMSVASDVEVEGTATRITEITFDVSESADREEEVAEEVHVPRPSRFAAGKRRFLTPTIDMEDEDLMGDDTDERTVQDEDDEDLADLVGENPIANLREEAGLPEVEVQMIEPLDEATAAHVGRPVGGLSVDPFDLPEPHKVAAEGRPAAPTYEPVPDIEDVPDADVVPVGADEGPNPDDEITETVAAPEPVVEAAPEPVVEAAPEPVVDAAPEPVVEAEPEPVVDAAPEPVVEATPEPVVEAAPASAPAAAPPAPAPAAARLAGAAGDVVAVDDDHAQHEMSRPARLRLIGWMVKGKVRLGNHTGADLVLPENRLDEDHVFEPTDYLALNVRGKKAQGTAVAADELRVDGDEVGAGSLDSLLDREIEVIRRDDEGDEDFAVALTLTSDALLPDARARFLQLDLSEPLTEAMVSHGIPLRQQHALELGALTLPAYFDGETLHVRDYLDSYRVEGGGFLKVLLSQGGARFVTLPEDGAELTLRSGDRVIVEREVFEVVFP